MTNRTLRQRYRALAVLLAALVGACGGGSGRTGAASTDSGADGAADSPAPVEAGPEGGGPVEAEAGMPDAGPDADAGPYADASVCPPGQVACAGACTDIETDEQNCGACGKACSAGQVCKGGACTVTCAKPETMCGSGAAAYCANLETASANCGSCGTTCAAGQVCSGGKCASACGPQFAECAQGCADTDTDPDNCGGCGIVCGPYAHAAGVCVKGQCQELCDPGYMDCSGTGTAGCNVDTQTDPDNCNGCGNACPQHYEAVAACVAGACTSTCTNGHLDCDGQAYDGCEVDSMLDSRHCGACGHLCTAGCSGGACRIAVAIGSGSKHSCAVLSDGSAWCWGDGFAGELGDGTSANHASPTRVSAIDTATHVVAGDGFSCALLSGGTVDCWGLQQYGQTGNGVSSSVQPTPMSVPGLSGVVALAAGDEHTCALLAGGTVDCWGSNTYGQLGDGTTTKRGSATPVPGLSGVTAIAAGGRDTCALLTGGGLECWGDNTYGQLGDGSTSAPKPTPQAVPITDVVGVACAQYHTCALVSDGSVYCWGRNASGELGDGSYVDHFAPARIVAAGFGPVSALAADVEHTCAVMADGSVDCWGYDYHFGSSNLPKKIAGVDGATAVTTGYEHTCALLSDGTERCWGANSMGQLGRGAIGLSYEDPGPVLWP